jgi:hypothetical protein
MVTENPKDGAPPTASSTEISCPACAKPMPSGASRCPNCGAALGEHQRCIHCHAIADVEPSVDARFVCTVCGGVRIPIQDPKIERSSEQLDLLKKATVLRSARVIWSVVASVVGGFGVFSVLVLWLVIAVAHPAPAGAVVAALAALVPFAFALVAFRRARDRAAELRPLLDKAWMAAAADIARARGGELDAHELSVVTRIDEAAADQLLGRMSADSQLTSSVTPEGNLKYTLLGGGMVERLGSPPSAE